MASPGVPAATGQQLPPAIATVVDTALVAAPRGPSATRLISSSGFKDGEGTGSSDVKRGISAKGPEHGDREIRAPPAVQAPRRQATSGAAVARDLGAPACRCGDRGCVCDLSVETDLDAVLLPLGYDQCVDDGDCVLCTEGEGHAVYCLPTGRRQRVVCARCASPNAPLPFCLPGFKILWSTNRSAPALVEKPTFASNTNESRLGASAGLFFRSCGTRASRTAKPRQGLNQLAQPVSNRTGYASGELAVPMPPRLPIRDETAEILCFLAINLIVFTLSVCSLRRQQQEKWEQTMGDLYSHVGTTSSRRDNKVERRSSGSNMEAGAVPEKIGRSIESLATSLSFSSRDLELAVFGEGQGSEQKMK